MLTSLDSVKLPFLAVGTSDRKCLPENCMGDPLALRLFRVLSQTLAGLLVDTLPFACVEQPAGSYVADG